ncbi:MAG: hypothetical protein M1812_004304 [Candelaria pacifica]|nr:MAG: hypothetical protein M1812_004304 [Candelaria pacifica]
MPYLFTTDAGAQQPHKTLVVDEYASRLYAEVLTPFTKSLGFKTYYNSKTDSLPILVDEEEYLKKFCQFWEAAVKEVAQEFGVTETEVLNSTTTAFKGQKEVILIPSLEDLLAVHKLFVPLEDFTAPVELVDLSSMADLPTLKTSGLSSVSEDNSASSPARKSAKVDVLKRLRPPPLPVVWGWWHDRVEKEKTESSTTTAHGSKEEFVTHPRPCYVTASLLSNLIRNTEAKAPDPTVHGDRLTRIELIPDLKAFWGTVNHFPFDHLKFRDTVHMFQRNIKPVWEDEQNKNGGSWTFRVPKSLSLSFFTKLLIMAVGGQMLEAAVEHKDKICGISMSIRFNSNLVAIWNFNGESQKSIDAILALVLAELPEDVKAKDISYFYKKHSEHQGFQEALATASIAAKKLAEDPEKPVDKKPEVTATKSNLSTSESADNGEVLS